MERRRHGWRVGLREGAERVGETLSRRYLLGLQLAIHRSKKAGLDTARVLDLGVYIVIAALVGAKLLLPMHRLVDRETRHPGLNC